MCGIAGVLSQNPAVIEPAVRRMMQAMVHRGPDDEGYEQFPLGGDSGSAAVGFGFRRLAIMDLSPLGHQPMVNRATGDAIIFNGEIYNFQSLRSRLPLASGLESSGDTAVLLQAFSTWGEAALDDLDGMFALAFYQAASRRILLARDHLGIKPLYIGTGRHAFVFGSEVRAVLASGLVPDDLDPAGIAGFLAYGSPQDPLTVHRYVTSLPAGTYRWVGAEMAHGGQSAPDVRYWRFPSPVHEESGRPASERVRSLLSAAVEQQCVADAPLGAFLSGGIDSASLVGLAQRLRPTIDTLAVGFDCANGSDESEAAAETANHLGTRHRQTIIDKDWTLLQWTQWIKAADRPTVDGLNTYIIAGAIKDLDLSVALSGVGGDELFCGYGTFRAVHRLQRGLACAAWIPPSVRRTIADVAAFPLSQSKRMKAVAIAGSRIDAVSLTLKLRRLAADEELMALGFHNRDLGLTEDFVSPTSLESVRLTGDTIAAVSQAELVFYMGNTLLRDADVYAMAHSLEVRVPFLSRRLVEEATAMPGRVRSPTRSKAKHVLREAMQGIVPDTVFTRPKSGFTLPLGEWMAGALRGDAEAAIEALAGCSLLPSEAVRQLWATYTDPKQSLHWSRAMSLVALGSYLSQHRERMARLQRPETLPS